MKISTKLGLLNAVVVLIFLLEGVLVFSFVNRVRDNAGNITGSTVPTLAAIPELSNAYSSFRRQALLWAAVPPEDKAEVLKNVTTAREKMRQSIADYAKTIDLDEPEDVAEDKRHYQDLIAAERDWEVLIDKLLTIQDSTEAVRFIRKVTSPPAAKVFEQITALVKFNLDIADRESKQMAESVRQLYTVTITISVVGSILALAIGIMIARGIARSLRSLQQQTAEVENTLDFSRRFDATARDEIGVTATALNSLLGVMQGSLRDISGVSKSVGERASELATNTAELSSANEMVSNSTASMAAAVEQVTVSVSHVAERSRETRDLAQQAGTMAESGSKKVAETITKINSIAERANSTALQVESLSQKVVDINTVVTTIKGIAEQTNLLALNAAIEAARAGDVGRGFAVVADEVRKLAERTSSATYEIANTIEQIQAEAKHTVTAIQQTVQEVAVGVESVTAVGDVVGQIQSSSHQVLSSVNDISEAMSEQSMASTSMAREIEKVAQMTEETSANAMGVADVGTQLNSYSQELLGIVARYKV